MNAWGETRHASLIKGNFNLCSGWQVMGAPGATPPDMQAPSARRLAKEAFVTGHAGTTLAEVSAIAAVPVACLLVLRCATGRALATAAATPVLEWAAFIPALLACQLDLVSARALLLAAALVAFSSQRLLPPPRPATQLPTPAQELR